MAQCLGRAWNAVSWHCDQSSAAAAAAAAEDDEFGYGCGTAAELKLRFAPSERWQRWCNVPGFVLWEHAVVVAGPIVWAKADTKTPWWPAVIQWVSPRQEHLTPPPKHWKYSRFPTWMGRAEDAVFVLARRGAGDDAWRPARVESRKRGSPEELEALSDTIRQLDRDSLGGYDTGGQLGGA